jgi:sugar phosphate isomerase/epimerase
MLREIRDLGFEYAELSHGIRISLLPGIFEAVQAGEIKISTLHNFCPLPIGVTHAAPNIFKFTSLEARERENAWRYSLKTLETAERLKARLVVLHMGAIDMKDYTERLLEMVENGLKETPKFEKLCLEAAEKRAKLKTRHMEFASEMLHRLAIEATTRGLLLGIENREAVEEIPFDDEFPFFLKDFPEPCIGYWHDTGHAQIKENIGFLNHIMHLENMADRLVGFHVHDVKFPGTDHMPPGQGTIDFAALKQFVKPGHIKVLELNPGLPSEAVKAGFDHIRSIWGTE